MASSPTWVPDVEPDSGFSLANIPFGIATTPNDASPHAVTAIGSRILELKVLLEQPQAETVFPFLSGHKHVFSTPSLNAFAELGRDVHKQVRSAIQDLLSVDSKHPDFLKDNVALHEKALLPRNGVKMCLPMQIGDYTDFYAGYHHAFGVGSMWRGPANALQPNYTHIPVGYHGRASSIVVSGHPIKRPIGQIVLDPTAEPKQPVVQPSQKLDMELELGCFVARGNDMGTPIDVNKADEHIFGYVLLNDWSARDIQNWEYVPLGPFNGKNFATTISPWVVTPDALEPFRSRGIDLEGRPPVQDYLNGQRVDSFFDIKCKIDLTTPEGDTSTISNVSTNNLLWSFPQMLAHHTLGGCPMRTGDLIASGTISGTKPSEHGSLLEMNEGGKKEVLLYGMDARKFLKDGDTITFSASCGNDWARVGFGECAGRIYSTLQGSAD